MAAQPIQEPAFTPPGPPPRSANPFATARYMLNFLVDSFGFIEKRFEQYGDIYYAPSGGVPLYVLKHPSHLNEVLVSKAGHYCKSHSALTQLEEVLGKALLTTDGDQWRRQRRLVQPAFSKKRMHGYGDVFVSETAKTLAGWNEGDTIDMSQQMMALTLRIVCRTLFGYDASEQTAIVDKALKTLSVGMSTARLTPDWLPTPGKRRFDDALASLDSIIYGMVDERKNSDQDGTDLLTALLRAKDDDGQGLDPKEIRDQLLTLFVAGHETTSHALTWSLYLLSQNREWFERLSQEADKAFGDKQPSLDDVEKLPLAHQVLCEAMRLYPPAYVVARKAQKDTQIGPYEVPEGSEVVMWIAMTHRDERWYPKPHQFRPERFEPTQEAKLPKCAYLPFGAGPRTCIGKRFAMLEATLILSQICHEFQPVMRADHQVSRQPRVTLAPSGGLPMVIRRRKAAK